MCSREVVCFQWDTNWISKYYVERNDRLCGLVVRVAGYRSRGPGSIPGTTRFFWQVVGLERGPLSLVSTTEELLGIENREYGRRDSSRWPRGTLYPQKKLALTSLTSGGIVSLRNEATGFFFVYLFFLCPLMGKIRFLWLLSREENDNEDLIKKERV
jgi:hypothetical protein